MQKLDNLLNKIKMRALEFLGQVFKYLFEKVDIEVKKSSPFLGKALQFCPFLIQSLLTFLTNST